MGLVTATSSRTYFVGCSHARPLLKSTRRSSITGVAHQHSCQTISCSSKPVHHADVCRRAVLSGFLGLASSLPSPALANLKVPAYRSSNLQEAQAIGEARREELEREKGELVRLPFGVRYREQVTGTGEIAERGKTLSITYQIFQQNGNYIDSVGYGLDGKDDVGETFKFPLGYGRVPVGIELGMEGMRVGGKRRISVPPEFGWIINNKQGCPKIEREGLFEVISRQCLLQPIPESSAALRRFSRPAQNALLFEVELVRVK